MKTHKIEQLILLEHFSVMPDPRRINHGRLKHELIDIIIIAIVATICGADNWVDIEKFGQAKEDWFKQFLKLENGIPSHDTFGRVFSILNPEFFEKCFREWIDKIKQEMNGEVIALDGKSVRRSHKKGQKPLHIVNALATTSGIILGQRKVDSKTNEITVIPELLDSLFLKGCIVTTDAMGTQGWIAQKIIENKGDYVLSLKSNQGRLHRDVQKIFDRENTTDILKSSYYHKTTEHSHGRDEIRECFVTDRLDQIRELDKWDKLQSLIRIVSTRTVNNTKSTETRYYISSLKPDAKQISSTVRAHWKVESMHWSLDVAFREDESRVRIKHAGDNLSLVRKMAFNYLKQETTTKGGLASRRRQAGWDTNYLKIVLGLG